uniref:Uncharacterized protein n=1 Tax=Panagrolaimus sp. ES5 TaxID=591445 RepID=A0AC34GY27_9BILA
MKTHKQFERKLMLQSIMPCFSLLALSVIFIYIFALPPQDANVQGGMLLLALMPLQYIVVLNPLITLFSIKSYRNAILCRPNIASPSGTQAFTIVTSSVIPLK